MMKKASQILFFIILAVVFVSVPVATVVGRSSVSFYEQRTLAHLPALTRASLADGSFFADAETFLSDHFGGRDRLIKADIRLRLMLDKPVVNGLVVNSRSLVTDHGFVRWDNGYLDASAAARAEQYRELQEVVEANGGYFCFLTVPYHSTYFASDYPAYMDDRLWHTDRLRGCFQTAMEAVGVPYLDMYTAYKAQGLPREFYYETDHHYSLRGGFAAYEALTAKLRAETDWAFSDNTAADDFDFVTLPNPFLGSANRKLYGLWETSDRAEIARPKADIPFTRTDNGVPSEARVYDVPENETALVTYSLYMGGDIGETVIRTDRPDRPNILIYGDSFSNALESLLWTQANELCSLDLRHYSAMTLREYIAEYKPDIVICVRDETVLYSETGNGRTD